MNSLHFINIVKRHGVKADFIDCNWVIRFNPAVELDTYWKSADKNWRENFSDAENRDGLKNHENDRLNKKYVIREILERIECMCSYPFTLNMFILAYALPIFASLKKFEYLEQNIRF